MSRQIHTFLFFVHYNFRKGDYMNIDIRSHIINNFKNVSIEDINNSIIDSINDKDDVTLPGLGVFFEILWSNSSEDERNKILKILKNNM